MNEIKRTSGEWEKLVREKHPSFAIMDPDGWDRTGDFDADWNKPITFNEWSIKASMSTCKFPLNMFDAKVEWIDSKYLTHE